MFSIKGRKMRSTLRVAASGYLAALLLAGLAPTHTGLAQTPGPAPDEEKGRTLGRKHPFVTVPKCNVGTKLLQIDRHLSR